MTPFDYCLIPLTQGQFARVSLHRFQDLNQFKWYAWWSKSSKSFYAFRNLPGLPHRTIAMHRQILGLKHGDSRHADHASHDTLDNTDGNLRACTSGQNLKNSRRRSDNSTGYRGVHRTRREGESPRYVAEIHSEGKKIVKRFPCTPEGLVEAARFYDQIAQDMHGEFANLNFPSL